MTMRPPNAQNPPTAFGRFFFRLHKTYHRLMAVFLFEGNEHMNDQDKIKGAAPNQENAPSKTLPAHRTKESVILTVLRSGQSLNRFEAEHLGDHCLHSTISTLRDKGYKFHDEWEWVPTRFGEVHVKRYAYGGGHE